MSIEHIVRPGETLSKIAEHYGFYDWRTIWDFSANQELAAQRKNPEVLAPLDVLVIPDKTPKTVVKPTEHRHVFQVQRSRLKLRLVLRDFDNQPCSSTKCTVIVEGAEVECETDADGLLEIMVPAAASSGEVRFQDPLAPFELVVPIRIGYLDPVDTEAGQMARLSNLGYSPGTVDAEDRTRFEYAVQEFQVDHDLPVDGICGAATQARLEEVHGS